MPTRAFQVPPILEGSYPVREGCEVSPLVDGEPAFRRICEEIEAAKRCVWGTVAFLEEGIQLPDGRGTRKLVWSAMGCAARGRLSSPEEQAD